MEQKFPSQKKPLSYSWNVHNLSLLPGQTKVQVCCYCPEFHLKNRQQPLLTYLFIFQQWHCSLWAGLSPAFAPAMKRVFFSLSVPAPSPLAGRLKNCDSQPLLFEPPLASGMARTLKDLAQSFNGCTWHSGKYFLHFTWPNAEIKVVRKIILSRKISEKLEVCFHPMFSVESL